MKMTRKKPINIGNLIESIVECHNQQSGYINLDTGRINQDSTVNRKKPRFINHKWRYFSETFMVYNQIDNILSSTKSFNDWNDTLIEELQKLTIHDQNKPLECSRKNTKRKKHSKQSKFKGIPADVRYKVWRSHCKDKMDGPCFCCDVKISFEKWHCGHIVSRARGGSIDSINLRPVCIKCNLAMSSMHMYEYIIRNKLPGFGRLSPTDPIVEFYMMAVDMTNLTNQRLNKLHGCKVLNKKEIDNYKSKIASSRRNMEERVCIMEEIKNKYDNYFKSKARIIIKD